MIDWSRVAQLRGEVGAEDFDEVVALFLEEVEEVMARLRSSPGRGRLDRDLHFLKGSALSLGFQSFSRLCQEGERLAACGRPESVDIPGIVEDYERSKATFFAGLPQYG
ncbi:Hpt domain-containing protein [Cribrihabitans sp. XS_ASV171]